MGGFSLPAQAMFPAGSAQRVVGVPVLCEPVDIGLPRYVSMGAKYNTLPCVAVRYCADTSELYCPGEGRHAPSWQYHRDLIVTTLPLLSDSECLGFGEVDQPLYPLGLEQRRFARR